MVVEAAHPARTETEPYRHRLLDAYRRSFVGQRVRYPTYSLEGQVHLTERCYLDSAATTLVSEAVLRGERDYLETSLANSHTRAHLAGRTTTDEIEEARRALGRFVGADPASDLVIFTGNGATGALNLLARALFPPQLRWLEDCEHMHGADAATCARFRPVMQELKAALRAGDPVLDALLRRPKVIVTMMEHHSNILPWVAAAGHKNVLYCRVRPDTTLDLDHLQQLLQENGQETRLVAVTGVSNVTGLKNPVHRIARLAHSVGAEIVVDAAQMAAHAVLQMHPPEEPGADIDYVVLSGHKIYAPGSRGGLVGRMSAFLNRETVGDLGGGMVEYVSVEGYKAKSDPAQREEAGTPNIPGTIRFGLSLEILRRIGMDLVEQDEDRLVAQALPLLAALPGVTVYGSHDLARAPRAGVFSFNVDDLHHGFVASVLNDYFNVAVRNECFCAQPYVKEQLAVTPEQECALQARMLLHDRRTLPGMVRASFGIYSTLDDVERLADALRFIRKHVAKLEARYSQNRAGDFIHHRGFHQDPPFTVAGAVDRHLDDLLRADQERAGESGAAGAAVGTGLPAAGGGGSSHPAPIQDS
ncbi:MAG TPA: aminotransferase class V-fold PLP-dependent enzyme [Myxococcota bacterium]|jgi:selenocysteine lyase/cysteine desulfurase|nr:aminotransferase class V-fold PLP-dependent enzyme [Myxococcota bacterium]